MPSPPFLPYLAKGSGRAALLKLVKKIRKRGDKVRNSKEGKSSIVVLIFNIYTNVVYYVNLDS